MESTWTVEMILHYCAALDEAARGDRLRLLEVVKSEQTAKLLVGVKALVGYVPPAVTVTKPAAPLVQVTLWQRIAEVLRKRGDLNIKELAEELDEEGHLLSARMQVFRRRGWVTIVGKVYFEDTGRTANVWRLNSEHARGGEGAEANHEAADTTVDGSVG
jgi:hypothetical protein